MDCRPPPVVGPLSEQVAQVHEKAVLGGNYIMESPILTLDLEPRNGVSKQDREAAVVTVSTHA